jgi:hypothetical protein
MPIEFESPNRPQWRGKKIRVNSEICLWGLFCCHLSCALAAGYCPSPLCKDWGSSVQRPTFNEIISWSRMNPNMVTMNLKRGSTSSKWLYLDWDGLIGLSNKIIQWFSCVYPTPYSNSEHLKQRAHRDIAHQAGESWRACPASHRPHLGKKLLKITIVRPM